MDARAQQAREHPEAAARTSHDADMHRRQRDQLVRALRAEDPGYWTYVRLAKAVGCSKELIALIFRPKKVIDVRNVLPKGMSGKVTVEWEE